MNCKARWVSNSQVGEFGATVVEVEFKYRGKGKRINRVKLFRNAVRALRMKLRAQNEKKSVKQIGNMLMRMYLDFIWTEVGQTIYYEETYEELVDENKSILVNDFVPQSK